MKIDFSLLGGHHRLSFSHWTLMPVIVSTIDTRYATLLWILPTPHTILAAGLHQELSPLVGNCKLLRFVLSGLGLRCKNYRRSKWRFLFDLTTFPLVVLEQRVQSHHNPYFFCFFFFYSQLQAVPYIIQKGVQLRIVTHKGPHTSPKASLLTAHLIIFLM